MWFVGGVRDFKSKSVPRLVMVGTTSVSNLAAAATMAQEEIEKPLFPLSTAAGSAQRDTNLYLCFVFYIFGVAHPSPPLLPHPLFSILRVDHASAID